MANLYSLSNFYGMSGYGSLFGGTSGSSLYNSLSEYSSLRSGAYGKLTRSYYGTQNTSSAGKTSGTGSVSSTAAYKAYSGSMSSGVSSRIAKSNTALSSVKSSASGLADSAKKLLETGKNSVFEKKEVKAEDGTVIKEYDKDAIYKEVKGFVDSYNSTVGALNDVTSSSVKNAGSSMQRMSGIMSKSLSDIGISVGTDGKLSVDEKTFKNADMDDVKTAFNGKGSYGDIISSSASRLSTQASNQIGQTNGSLYGSSASLYSSYVNGSLYNGYF